MNYKQYLIHLVLKTLMELMYLISNHLDILVMFYHTHLFF